MVFVVALNVNKSVIFMKLICLFDWLLDYFERYLRHMELYIHYIYIIIIIIAYS